jgi:hypothetical protein
MAPKTLSAKDVLKDLKSGLTNDELKDKYKLSDKGLNVLFEKLIKASVISESELHSRGTKAIHQAAISPSNSGTIDSPAKVLKNTQAVPQEEKQDPLFAKIAEDVRNGLHNNEIMMRYEIGPGRLKEIINHLSAKGEIPEPESADRLGRSTKLCPGCSSRIPNDSDRCPSCGREFNPELNAAGMQPAQVDPYLDAGVKTGIEEDKFCPWEQRDGYGLWNGYFQTAMESLLRPAVFFSRLPLDWGYGNPITFSIFSVALSVPISILLIALFKGSFFTGVFGVIFGFLCALIGAAITTPIVMLIWGGLTHMALILVQGAKADFQATFRVLCYSSVTQLFNAIPILGNIASLYGVVLAAIGLKEVHGISMGKSIGALAISIGILLLFAFAIYGFSR